MLPDNEMLKRQTESMTPKCNCGRLSLFFLFIFLIIGVRTGTMSECVIVDTTTMFAIVNDIDTCMFFEVVNHEYQCIMMGFWLIYWLRCPVNHEIGVHVNYVCSYWMCSNAGLL